MPHSDNKHYHIWGSKGEKRSIAVPYSPLERILKYLRDMRGALAIFLAQGYAMAEANPKQEIPSPVALRRKVKPWFDTAYVAYAMRHVNPACRTD